MHSKANDELDCTVGRIKWKEGGSAHQIIWRRQFSGCLLFVPSEGVMIHSQLRQKSSVFLRMASVSMVADTLTVNLIFCSMFLISDSNFCSAGPHTPIFYRTHEVCSICHSCFGFILGLMND